MLKRYDLVIDWKQFNGSERGEEAGYSADSTLKIIEQAMRDGATRIFVKEHGKGLFHDHPWRE